jgi:hypothetical protein
MEPVQELDPKEEALANLLAEVDAASEVALKRDVLGRVPGFYAGLASGKGELTSHLQKQYYPGRGGKRRKYTRKQRGGAACDSWIVSLAVDSAIILAGAAAFAGTSYGGFKTLSYYMSTYGLPDAIVEIITAFYETLKTLLTDSVPAVASGVGSAATGIFSGFTSLFNAASTVTKPGLPAVGVYRYFFQQGTSAREDAARIADAARTKVSDAKKFAVGVMTRSMRKKEALQASIAQTNQNVRAALTNARDAASTQTRIAKQKVRNLKDFICGLIDGAVNKTVTTANALLRITQFFANLRLQDDERVQPPVGAAAGAAAAFDAEVLPGPDSPRADSPILPGSPRSDSSRPGSPILPDSPRSDSSRPGSPILPDSPRSDDDEDIDLAASEQLRGIFQGGKRHRKRTMHQRSKKHHKGKKSRKHMHRRR